MSGFHIAGFNAAGEAEFWFVRNLDDNGRLTLGRYEAREDFQRRDAAVLPPGRVQIYRNGDIRAHALAWESIDQSLGKLLEMPDFRPLSRLEDYTGWVKFKMELIARCYEKYCTESIIGAPIDAFAFTRTEFAVAAATDADESR